MTRLASRAANCNDAHCCTGLTATRWLSSSIRLPFLSDQQWEHVAYVWRGLRRRPIFELLEVLRDGAIDHGWRVVEQHRRPSADEALRDALSFDIALKDVAPFNRSLTLTAVTRFAATALLYRDLLDPTDFNRYYAPLADVIPLADCERGSRDEATS